MTRIIRIDLENEDGLNKLYEYNESSNGYDRKRNRSILTKDNYNTIPSERVPKKKSQKYIFPIFLRF